VEKGTSIYFIYMEYEVHSAKPALLREIRSVVQRFRKAETVCVAIFMQDLGKELVDEREVERKDWALQRFMRVAEELDRKLEGFNSDFVDPSSGLLVKSEDLAFFSDVDMCSRVMKLPVVACGGCMMVEHPRFGQRFYPSTFISDAPKEVIERKIREITQEFGQDWFEDKIQS
jgi:hypothetical protein